MGREELARKFCCSGCDGCDGCLVWDGEGKGGIGGALWDLFRFLVLSFRGAGCAGSVEW